MKPNLYVGSVGSVRSVGATGQCGGHKTVCGQTDKWGEALPEAISSDSEPPPRTTPGLWPACQIHYREQASG